VVDVGADGELEAEEIFGTKGGEHNRMESGRTNGGGEACEIGKARLVKG